MAEGDESAHGWKKELPPPAPGETVMDLGRVVMYGAYEEPRAGEPRKYHIIREFYAPGHGREPSENTQAAERSIRIFGQPTIRRENGHSGQIIQLVTRFAGVVGPAHEPWVAFINGGQLSRLVRVSDYEASQSKGYRLGAPGQASNEIQLTCSHIDALAEPIERTIHDPDVASEVRKFLADVALQLQPYEATDHAIVDNSTSAR